MIHELKQIINAHLEAKKENITSVLATVVALEGSSYRRPGVRMLMLSDGRTTGAVSGGCVEKEIWRQAQTVFTSNTPRMMTYDGRYRLGCEGILYILIEPFSPNKEYIRSFWNAVEQRKMITVKCSYASDHGPNYGLGSMFKLGDEWHAARKEFQEDQKLIVFDQQMKPCHRLLIIGAEHDAVQLCYYASLTGWEVTIVAAPSEEKSIEDFPGASEFLALDPEGLELSAIDDQTSVVLMTHNYVKDLSFLIRIRDTTPGYLGLLGPERRREKLLNEFLERFPESEIDFIEGIHGPAGLDLGAETPQEIAISVISEVLSVYRHTDPQHLKNKSGAIHNS